MDRRSATRPRFRHAAVSRTTYADLFTAIGTAYGAGDGSTTFNVPDYRNRVVMGKSSTRAVGATGGAETHTLVPSEIPAHTHDRGTYRLRLKCTRSGGTTNTGGWKVGLRYNNNVEHDVPDLKEDTTSGSVGGNGAHNNLQPYAVATMLIKT